MSVYEVDSCIGNVIRNTGKTKMKNVGFKKRMEYLYNYEWSSLKGYLDPANEFEWVEYHLVLTGYGKSRSKAADAYRAQLVLDLKGDLTIEDKVVGQRVLGSYSYVSMIKQTYLDEAKDREIGERFGVDYSPVSQNRKRLRERVKKTLS